MDEETKKALAEAAKKAAEEAVKSALASVKATNNAAGMPGTSGGASIAEPTAEQVTRYQVGEDRVKGTGIRAIRVLKARAVARMEGRNPVEVLNGWGYRAEAKALSSLTQSAGAQLIHHEYAGELIELLRDMAVVRKAGARAFTMGASIEFDRQSSAGTAYYGNAIDNTSITASEQGTDAIRMSEKKLTALTAVPNDLIRNASVSAEEFVRQDLLNVMALREDLAFIRGSGVAGEPQGIRYQLHSDHIYAETMTTEGSPTLTEAKAELLKAQRKIKRAKVRMVKPAIFMASNAEFGFQAIAGPGGDGTNQLEAEYARSKTLYGIPVYVTDQIPTNLGPGDESELYLVEMTECMIGESMNLELEVFPNGTWNDAGNIKSGISNDMTVIRAIAKHDFAMRHNKAGVCVTELSWGYA